MPDFIEPGLLVPIVIIVVLVIVIFSAGYRKAPLQRRLPQGSAG